MKSLATTSTLASGAPRRCNFCTHAFTSRRAGPDSVHSPFDSSMIGRMSVFQIRGRRADVEKRYARPSRTAAPRRSFSYLPYSRRLSGLVNCRTRAQAARLSRARAARRDLIGWLAKSELAYRRSAPWSRP